MTCESLELGSTEGTFNGLQALIQKENKSAYFVHCFAHRFLLTLVSVVKNLDRVSTFFTFVSNITNVISSFSKRMNMLRERQKVEILRAFEYEEIVSGRGLNQELSLRRASDTRWSSHYNCLLNLTTLFPTVISILDEITREDGSVDHRREASLLLNYMQSFEFVIILFLIKDTFNYISFITSIATKRTGYCECNGVGGDFKDSFTNVTRQGLGDNTKFGVNFLYRE